jgi:hypothetical protein
MESASVADTDPKQDDPQGMPRADGELNRAYEQIKSAGEELTRLDRLVSGLERGSGDPPIRPEAAGAERSAAPAGEAAAPENKARHSGLTGQWPMLRALVVLLLAIGIFAAFALRYGSEARAIMARWAPQTSTALQQVSELRGPTKSLTVQVAAADQQPSPPAPSSHREAEGSSSTDATASTDVAKLLRAIAHDLTSIDEKLEQLKSTHEQTLREHADAIQQLKAAQEQNARDNARIAEQVAALQTQLAVLSAKSSGQSVKKENVAAARQHLPAAAPRRPPRRPRGPWLPPPDMAEPWFDPDW